MSENETDGAMKNSKNFELARKKNKTIVFF